jgi:hypothetical protein
MRKPGIRYRFSDLKHVKLRSPTEAGLAPERVEELRLQSKASFVLRATHELRAAWLKVYPEGRVDAMMIRPELKIAIELTDAHLEFMPFPWHPQRIVWCFRRTQADEPVVMSEPTPMDAVADDGIQVSPLWLQICIDVVKNEPRTTPAS